MSSLNLAAIVAVLIALFAIGYALVCKNAAANAQTIAIAADRNAADQREIKVAAIAVGGRYHSLALDAEGKVYATGMNESGQLGFGDDKNRQTFALVASLEDKKIVAIAAGFLRSLALDSDGKVYATGYNEDGGLGLGDYDRRDVFTPVKSLRDKNVTAIATSGDRSLALTSEGKLYATDINDEKSWLRIGADHRIGADYFTFTLVPLPNGEKIVAISAGEIHFLALSSEGKTYAAGTNEYGALGLGDVSESYTFFTPVTSLESEKIARVAAGNSHSLALNSEGKVYAAGWNYEGQLGLGDTDMRENFTLVSSLSGAKIAALAAGSSHSLALDFSGRVYATGYNKNGQLGLGDNKNRQTWTLVSSLSGAKIVAIAAGDYHSFAIDESGKVYATGMNEFGQLGVGDQNDRAVFTPAILRSR
ncbi:MAG: hypothetical protein LBO72_10765 [Helicobacteraceae bacterium]|jgi:alpha-tubulin suppressor-like RCC1 family protein|nr:hypothetical protein [Helicobacteraceae bacterium]